MFGDMLTAALSSDSPQALCRQNSFSVSDLLRVTTAEEPSRKKAPAPSATESPPAPAIAKAVIDEGDRASIYSFWIASTADDVEAPVVVLEEQSAWNRPFFSARHSSGAKRILLPRSVKRLWMYKPQRFWRVGTALHTSYQTCVSWRSTFSVTTASIVERLFSFSGLVKK
jgi:hypothetical protein